MERSRVGGILGCVGAALIVAVVGVGSFLGTILGGERSYDRIGGGWKTESIRHSLGGDSSFQWRLLREKRSILVEPDVRDIQYCGSDCVLYATWSEKDGHHFRAACGNRRPVLFVPPTHEIWRIKDCRLMNVEFGAQGESYIPLLSADEIRRKATAQPKAALKRHWLRLEYVGSSRD